MEGGSLFLTLIFGYQSYPHCWQRLMTFFRQHIAPFLVVLTFLFALVAVSARIFLPADMVAPAPIEEVQPKAEIVSPEAVADLPSTLKVLVQGLPDIAPAPF
jgi:hypothetical protein